MDAVGLNFVIALALFAKKFQLIDLQTTGLDKINEFDLKPVINLRKNVRSVNEWLNQNSVNTALTKNVI